MLRNVLMRFDALGIKQSNVTQPEQLGDWFSTIIEQLLNATEFLVNGVPYRFAELEAYYYAPGHRDYFSHRDPVTLENGRWYFHRTHGQYRNGSFKGIDLTFGDGTAYFGILIRTIIDPTGKLIDGPSLTVDHILAQTATKDVPSLDKLIDKRKFWDTTSPVAIRKVAKIREAQIYRSSRVGLSLRKARGYPEALKFVAIPYRYLTEPRLITKGKIHLVLSLHRLGESVESIHKLTGSPRKTIERYIAGYETGKTLSGFEGYIGKDLSRAELSSLLGTWSTLFGNSVK